ncbi:MAG: hypothetical protein ABW092_17775 [Candidatus Thiodiazotropha sp.]
MTKLTMLMKRLPKAMYIMNMAIAKDFMWRSMDSAWITQAEVEKTRKRFQRP